MPAQAVDIAAHVVADEGYGVPGSQAEAFQLLARHAIVSAELAERLAGVVKVRNRVVHGYASVDFAWFWHELPSGITALEEFSACLAAWLDCDAGPSSS